VTVVRQLQRGLIGEMPYDRLHSSSSRHHTRIECHDTFFPVAVVAETTVTRTSSLPSFGFGAIRSYCTGGLGWFLGLHGESPPCHGHDVRVMAPDIPPISSSTRGPVKEGSRSRHDAKVRDGTHCTATSPIPRGFFSIHRTAWRLLGGRGHARLIPGASFPPLTLFTRGVWGNRQCCVGIRRVERRQLSGRHTGHRWRRRRIRSMLRPRLVSHRVQRGLDILLSTRRPLRPPELRCSRRPGCRSA
jgi:hypothetical protein